MYKKMSILYYLPVPVYNSFYSVGAVCLFYIKEIALQKLRYRLAVDCCTQQHNPCILPGWQLKATSN